MNAETQQISTRKIVKKVSVNVVNGGKKPDIFKLADYIKMHGGDESVIMPIAQFIGRASDFEAGTSDFGDFIKLIGSFEGLNMETGEVFVSGVCFLPGSGTDLVYGALKPLVEGAAGGSIDFIFQVGIRKDLSARPAATGYVYDVVQVMAPGAADPLAALRQMPGVVVPTLAAPAGSVPAALEQPKETPVPREPGEPITENVGGGASDDKKRRR